MNVASARFRQGVRLRMPTWPFGPRIHKCLPTSDLGVDHLPKMINQVSETIAVLVVPALPSITPTLTAPDATFSYPVLLGVLCNNNLAG